MQPTESYCGRCKEVRAIAHHCYGDKSPKPLLDAENSDGGPVYSYDRAKYRLEPVKEKCTEGREAFRVVER